MLLGTVILLLLTPSQFLHAVPELFRDTSKQGNCFIVSGLKVVWVWRLKVAVRRGINSLMGKLCCGQTAARNLAFVFCVLYGVLTGAI